jgi:hypothetical protein
VQAVGVDGTVDKEATKVALWLHAERICKWLDAEDEFKKNQVSTPSATAPKPAAPKPAAPKATAPKPTRGRRSA